MKSGICPKCSSRRIIRHNLSPSVSVSERGEGAFYTCADCAFTEWYMDRVAKLIEIADGNYEQPIMSLGGVEIENTLVPKAKWVNPDQSPYR